MHLFPQLDNHPYALLMHHVYVHRLMILLCAYSRDVVELQIDTIQHLVYNLVVDMSFIQSTYRKSLFYHNARCVDVCVVEVIQSCLCLFCSAITNKSKTT